MKTLFILLLSGLIFSSCQSDDEITLSDTDYLIFGHYYGMCAGESCVETYKITSDELFEDSLDLYGHEKFEFFQLGNDLFERVKDLQDKIPSQLLKEKDQQFGCPDCADGGGLYIELNHNGKTQTWHIDQFKQNVPEYLHGFMDAVNARIALIQKKSSKE